MVSTRLTACLSIFMVMILLGTSTASGGVPAQPTLAPAWPPVPPVASYAIAVRLDPQAHTLDGHETITYHNRTGETITELVFHLYLNAFSGPDTTFMRESGGISRGFVARLAQPGWTKVETLALLSPQAVDLLPAAVVSETLMTVPLPQPLLPGQVLTLSLDFHAQLPAVFARTGFAGDFHMVGQWFPKLSVYREGRGWNAHQFHANSEFFADFGTYDVTITVPEGYVVGATGLPAGRDSHADGTVTHHYHAEAVIDFVWTAWPRFQESSRRFGAVEVVLLYPPGHERYVERFFKAAEICLREYGDWYGPYPYPRLTIVDVPENAGGAGGMEYPMLVTAGPPMSWPLSLLEGLFPEAVTVHEIAHQWWQSTVATNEFEEPWLDEGFTEYSMARLLGQFYETNASSILDSRFEMDLATYLAMPALPMYGRAWDFSGLEYTVAVYQKPVAVLTTMERILGEERWLSVLRTYYRRYQFGHPTTEDFLAVVAEVAGPEVRNYLEPLVYGRGMVDYAVSEMACAPADRGEACTVTISRLGEVALPVEVEAAFADGRRVRESWDGKAESKNYVYNTTAPLESVQVDPAGKIPLDISPLNNSRTQQVQAGAVLRIAYPWLNTLQHLILTLGGLW